MKKRFSLFLFLSLFVSVSCFGQKKAIEKGTTRIPLQGGFIYAKETDSDTTSLSLEKYDCSLHEELSVVINLKELEEVKYFTYHYNESNDGVLMLDITDGENVLHLYLNYQLEELKRVFFTEEEYKLSYKTKEPQKNMLPSRHKALDALDYHHLHNDLYTEDGALYLYYDNSDVGGNVNTGAGIGISNVGSYADREASTTLMRYTIKDSKYTQLWKCSLADQVDIDAYKMLLRGNKLFLLLLNGIEDDNAPGMLSIICLDYQSGEVIWKSKVEMAEGLRPQMPVWSYDAKTDELALAGIAIVPGNWKKAQRNDKVLTRIYTGTLNNAGKAAFTFTPMPLFDPANFKGHDMVKSTLERTSWLPAAVVKRPDGTYLAAGAFSFINYMGDGAPHYLDGTRWVGGALFATFAAGGKETKLDTSLFAHYGLTKGNFSEFSPYYWNSQEDKFYLGIFNSNEDAVAMTEKVSTGYYLLEIVSGKKNFVFLKEEHCKATASGVPGWEPAEYPYFLAVSDYFWLHIPMPDDTKQPSEIVSGRSVQ